MLCETFLNNINYDKFNIPGYNFAQSHRKNCRGGGVGIYISTKFQYTMRDDIAINVESEFESIFVEINDKSQKLIVGEIYRVPNTNEILSIERYESITHRLDDFVGDVIIGSDQNFNFINAHVHRNTSLLLDNFIASGFIPTITKPTRITHSTSTLIDNIYIRTKSFKNLNSGIITSDISDHLPIYTFIGKTELNKHAHEQKKIRPLNEDSLQNINKFLTSTNWNVLQTKDVDQCTEYLTKKIHEALDLFAPEKTLTLSSKNILRQDWMTLGFLKSTKTKYQLYRHALGKPKHSTEYIKFTKYRNKYNTLLRKCKIQYYNEILIKYKNDSRKTWSVLNQIIKNNNNKNVMSDIFNIGNKKEDNPDVISNEFCKYFSEVGNKFASKIPKSKKPFSDHLKNINPHSMFFTPTDCEEVY